jgi:hypothetical protein
VASQPVKLYCAKSFHKEPRQLIEVFLDSSQQALGHTIDIRQIKSASVFPEIIENQQTQEHQMCWDLQYWEFFDKFALELSRLHDDISYRDTFISQISGLFCDFLVLKLISTPELAYCLQVNRERRFGLATDEKIAISKDSYHRYIEGGHESVRVQARHLAFNHELFHIYYKQKLPEKVSDRNRLSKLADFYLQHDLRDNIKGESFEELLLGGFNALLKADAEKMLEEASCDYRALIETLAIFRAIEPSREQDFISQIHDSFRINQALLSYFSNLLFCWTILSQSYSRVGSYDELLQVCQPELDKAAQIAVIRNTIIPDFLEVLSEAKYGTLLFESVLEQQVIKDAIHETANGMVDIGFMLYVIEESIRLSNLPDFNPFELKNIVLENAGYV